MRWRDKLLVRILMLVAKIVAEPEWLKEIDTLATHISVNAPEEKAEYAH